MRRIILACALAGVLGVPAFGQGVDPYIGVWKLNLEKTTYIGGTVPKSMIMTISAADGHNLALTLDVVGPQGGTDKLTYTMIFDGQPHPGSRDYDSTAYIRFGNTITQIYFKDGKAVVAGQSRIDSDKQYTYTSEGVLASGQPTRRVLVWDKIVTENIPVVGFLYGGSPDLTQGVDPLIGTRKLNLEKSTSISPLPKNIILTYSAAEGGLIGTNNVVDANGQALKVTLRHTYDGMPHPTTGSPNYDATSYTRIGNTLNAIRFKEGKPVEVNQGLVAGKIYTVTAEGVAANGQPYRFVYVFDRQ